MKSKIAQIYKYVILIISFFLITLLIARILTSISIGADNQNGTIEKSNEELEAQNVATNVENVEFDAYFLVDGEKRHWKENNMEQEETLILELNVKEKGSLKDAKIKIDNTNFEINKDKVSSNVVKNINTDTNEIELNEIMYKNNTKIEVPIVFKKQKVFEDSYFERENTITLTGKYADEQEKDVSGRINTKMIWKQEAEVLLNSTVKKFLNLEEGNILLQQNITTDIKDNKLPRKNEEITIQAPVIDTNLPSEAIVLLNGTKMDNEDVDYNKETGIIKVYNDSKGIWKNSKNEYDVIYKYTENVEFSKKEIALEVSSASDLYTQGIVEQHQGETVQINKKGNIVSIEKETTESLYKGYMYAGGDNETSFEEVNSIEISEINTINSIEIQKGEEVFSDESGKLYKGSQNICYKSTLINKNNFIELFGTEGEIQVIDQNNQTIVIINNSTSMDKNGNIEITYPEGSYSIKFVTSKPIKEGQLYIKNSRVIKGDAGYSKKRLKNFSKLITKTKVITEKGEDVCQSDIVLKDTKTEAKLEINNSNLSTLQKNEDVQLLLTLKSNNSEYDLYKNPQIEIILPKELNINVKSIEQINKENEISIKDSKIYTNENNEQVISLDMRRRTGII